MMWKQEMQQQEDIDDYPMFDPSSSFTADHH